MAETADEGRSRLEKIQQDYPTRDPAIARMSRSGNADLDRLWMEMEANRRLAESLEKSPPESWNADLKRRMMEADRRWAMTIRLNLSMRRCVLHAGRARQEGDHMWAEHNSGLWPDLDAREHSGFGAGHLYVGGFVFTGTHSKVRIPERRRGLRPRLPGGMSPRSWTAREWPRMTPS